MLKDGEKGAVLQRDKTTYAIVPHFPCGVITPAQLRRLADVAEKHGVPAMKLTSAERIALVGIAEDNIDRVWAELDIQPGHAVGLCIRSVKACPGTTFCRLGQQDALGMGMKLDQQYHGLSLPGKFKIGVSGCMNQCTETCIKDIGLVGKKAGWTVLVGGCGGARPRLAQVLDEGLGDEDALALVARIVEYYEDNGKSNERLGHLIDRVGFEEFKNQFTC